MLTNLPRREEKKGGSHIKVKEAKFPVVVGMGPVSWLPEKSLERKKERERKKEVRKRKEKKREGLKSTSGKKG